MPLSRALESLVDPFVSPFVWTLVPSSLLVSPYLGYLPNNSPGRIPTYTFCVFVGSWSSELLLCVALRVAAIVGCVVSRSWRYDLFRAGLSARLMVLMSLAWEGIV